MYTLVFLVKEVKDRRKYAGEGRQKKFMKNNMENLKKVENVEQLWENNTVALVTARKVRGTKSAEFVPVLVNPNKESLARVVASLPVGKYFDIYLLAREENEYGDYYVSSGYLALNTVGNFLNQVYFSQSVAEKEQFAQMVSEYHQGKAVGEIPFLEAAVLLSEEEVKEITEASGF